MTEANPNPTPVEPTGKAYETDEIKVYFDAAICRHSANCVRGLPAVFDTGRRPWIVPANAPADEVAAQIRRCPTGALQYRGKGEEPAASGS